MLFVLKKFGIILEVLDEDGIIRGLICFLEFYDFLGKIVMVQFYGENVLVFIVFFEEKGVFVLLILFYQYILLEEEMVEWLCWELMNGEIDVVCFIMVIQVCFLFDFVKVCGYIDEVKVVFEEWVIVVVVGKVIVEVLWEEGIMRLFVLEIEWMGVMIVELFKYYEEME